VLRPAGAPSYTGAGTSADETPSGPSTQAFAASLPIQAGDAIGLENANKPDMVGVAGAPGGKFVFWDPPLADGSTRAGSPGFGELEIAFSADVQPPPAITSLAPTSG
jgi:hypothetical protein